MQYTTLGNTGMEVSRICLGCAGFSVNRPWDWALGEEDSTEIIERAIDLGINFFDTGNVYSNGESEQILGQTIAGHREQSVVGTKVHPYNGPDSGSPNLSGGYSRKAIQREVDRSRDRLGLDTIDLYQLHFLPDRKTPIEQTLRTMDDLVREGKTRYIGASSSWTYEFAEALYKSEILDLERFQTMQNHYNLVYREEEREKLPLCKKEDIGVIPYSPLARGYLARPHQNSVSTDRSETEDLFQERKPIYESGGGREINERVQELATDKGVKIAQISLAWLLHKDWVDAPIVGTTSVEHLEDAVEALEITLTDSEMEYLEEPYEPGPVMGPEQIRYSDWQREHGVASDE